MNPLCAEIKPPLSGENWAIKAETYAVLISEHLNTNSIWLDAGCGCRLLEEDLDSLEDWLIHRCRLIIGLDVTVARHRNINLLVSGSLYTLPFPDNSLDLVTCNMVVEHLQNPVAAFTEIARCLKRSGAFILRTPNLLNYGIMANAIASKAMPEKWRLRLVHGTDGREPEDFFPVRYKANTMRSLMRLLKSSGLEVHRTSALRQCRPYFRWSKGLERILMKLTPTSALLVCAHKKATRG